MRQVTAQDLATMMRHKLNCIIFLINNKARSHPLRVLNIESLYMHQYCAQAAHRSNAAGRTV